MAKSQNGWPIVPRTAIDETALLGRIRVPNGVLKGDVAVIFNWLAAQYDKRVEPLVPGTCWGWFVKPIEGSSVASNHGSGTAVDFNAPQNPMGKGTTRRSMTPRQIDTCHAIESESDDVLRWGGDYVSRNDPMHWEIVGSRPAVTKLANKIRNAGKPLGEKMPTMITIPDVQVPDIKEGDRDDKLAGYNTIVRIQRIVGVDDDGWWGPDTTKAIAAWCKVSIAQATRMTADLYRKVYGLS